MKLSTNKSSCKNIAEGLIEHNNSLKSSASVVMLCHKDQSFLIEQVINYQKS